MKPVADDSFYKSLYEHAVARIEKLLATVEMLRLEREILLSVIKDYKDEFLKLKKPGDTP